MAGGSRPLLGNDEAAVEESIRRKVDALQKLALRVMTAEPRQETASLVPLVGSRSTCRIDLFTIRAIPAALGPSSTLMAAADALSLRCYARHD
jgi:hypothetical protein